MPVHGGDHPEGEQVVLLSLGGNLETAFALPAVYSNQFAPPSTSADACVTEHPDGGWFEYEPPPGAGMSGHQINGH